MSDASTLRHCYVFGPWTDCAPEDPIRAVREAPNPSERAEVWLYVREDDGTPVSNDVAGWYGCFGAMEDSRRLGGQHLSVNSAKGRLDAMIRNAGHLFAEELAAVRAPTPATPTNTVPSLDALARELFRASLDGPEVQTRRYDTESTQDRLRWLDVALAVRSKYIEPFNTPATPAPATDTPVGDDRAPDRYMASGRETIDEVRDVCRHLAGHKKEKLADALFALHCLLTAYVYHSRAGLNGPAAQDHAKADWYIQMARHVAATLMVPKGLDHMVKLGRDYSDPRCQRPTYQHYSAATATLPPLDFDKLRDMLMPYELDVVVGALGSSGYLYQEPVERGHGFSRSEQGINGGGSTTFTPTMDEIEAILSKSPGAQESIGNFSVRRCTCGGVFVGGFRCSGCGAMG